MTSKRCITLTTRTQNSIQTDTTRCKKNYIDNLLFIDVEIDENIYGEIH